MRSTDPVLAEHPARAPGARLPVAPGGIRRALAAFALVLGVAPLLAGCLAPSPSGAITTATRASTATQAAASNGTSASARDARSGLAVVPASALPAQARRTIALIHRGGPYPYEEDDSTFGNFERVLPAQPRGYYREYTVRTPGERDRGARRIVAGRDGALYWTEDHYATFRAIAENR